MNIELEKILTELDQSTEQANERSISKKIDSVASNDENLEAKSERMAFAFCDNYENYDSGWGTYYGPMMVSTDDDGNIYESPSLSLVTKPMLDYWELRASQTSNYLMKARYAGLVWDFTQTISGSKPDHKIAIDYIHALISVCEQDLCKYPNDAIKKITRAYKVACSLNNEHLIKKCINTAIKLEDRIGEDDKAGRWGFCFDLFVLGKAKHLAEKQKNKLLKDLEARLLRVSLNKSPWDCEDAGIPLATYYRANNQTEDVRRVVELVGSSFEVACEGQVAMQASSLYQRAHDIYTSFNLKDKAEAVSKKIAQIGPDVIGDMQELSHEMEIPKEELDAYLEAITEGGMECALNRIASEFIPQKNKIEKQVQELAKNHPITYLFSKTLQDHKGRPVATIGPLADDLEGNAIHQLSKNMQIDSFFLRHSFIRLVEKYETKAGDLSQYFLRSPVFEDSKKKLIEYGTSVFLKGDYIAAIHILVPQVEAAVRTLVELMGSATLRRNRQGGLQLRTFDDLLRDENVGNCFGVDVGFYFRILLTDQRGWNMRNDVCHGISPSSAFNCSTADRIMHVMLCLAQIRKKND